MRTEDGKIVSKCLNGEPEAFGFLVDRYKESVYAFAYSKLRNFHDAEDVTQEVFLKAYQKLRTLRRWDSFHAWIYSIASNLCKNWIREPTGKLPGTWGGVKKTELLQNFPNPFNPETWIPFSLAEQEHVAIRIYSSTGQLVRTIDLGQKPPGAYLSKEKAAYWDGRNKEGEELASGIYFYVMNAGDFTATKKMTVNR